MSVVGLNTFNPKILNLNVSIKKIAQPVLIKKQNECRPGHPISPDFDFKIKYKNATCFNKRKKKGVGPVSSLIQKKKIMRQVYY